ncbi:MAG: glycosyltransferase family 4 protein [Chloroflexota bacterium]
MWYLEQLSPAVWNRKEGRVLRICFILSELSYSGGVRCVVEYANRLSARGHSVSVVTSGGTDERGLNLSRYVHVVIAPGSIDRRGMLRSWRLGKGILDAVPPGDVVIATHTPTVPIVVAAARLLRRGQGAWLCMDYPEMFSARPLQSLIFGLAPVCFKTILCLSQSTAQELRGRRLFRAAGSVTVVGLGLSDQSTFRPANYESRDRHEVLYVGDSRPRKGLAEVLAAMSIVSERLPDVRLTVVSREDLSHLSENGTSYSIRHILSPNVDTLARLYGLCGVFVSASWAEGFGLPPLEAMACGAPVVVTDSRGVREFARHEGNCLLIPPRDPKALAEAIVRLLLDRDLAARLGTEGIRTAGGFDWEEAVNRFESALRQLQIAASS